MSGTALNASRSTGIISDVIQSFADADTAQLFYTGRSRRWSSLAAVARRKLQMLDDAVELADLGSPPGNRLEALKGVRAGQHSIRINVQYRICFVWRGGPHDVEIVDYH